MATDRPFAVRAASLLLVTLALSAPALADTIYRCETETGVIFSDRPCGDQARAYSPAAGLSVVPATEQLAEIEADNQAFQQREAERRQARREARQVARSQSDSAAEHSRQPPASGQVTSGIRLVPEWIQQDRRLQADERPRTRPERITRDEPPYSALSGRLPGTRRESDALLERQRPERNPP